jgi:uncharacterized protein YjbI with pentapeptide repeats
MPAASNGQMFLRSKQTAKYVIAGLSFLVIPFLFNDCVFAADVREDLHQRILAGEQVSLNPSSSEDARTIDAKWLKEAAARHVRIEIYHAIIQGPLDVQDVIFEQGFTLGDCTVKDYADFSHAIFKHEFFASDTIFRSWVSFRETTFEYATTLQRARFESSIVFDDAHFVGAFDVTEAKFSRAGGTAVFIRVRFDGAANFPFAQFDDNVLFISTQFGGQGFFPGTRFGGSVQFDRSHFFDITTFGSDPSQKKFNAVFAGKAFFTETQFDSTVDFDGVTFENDVDFDNAKFRSTATFRGATFKSLCMFSTAQFGSDGYFMGAKFLGQAVFESAHVVGSLYFQAEKPLPAVIFREDAQFTNIQVENIANFGGGNELVRGAVFGGKALFNMARIRGLSDFQGAEFKGDAEFIDVSLGNDAYFLGTIFEGDAAFDRADIMGAALFSPQAGVASSKFTQPARFAHKASFSTARFGSETRFSKVRFDGNVDFVGAHFEGDAHFEESVFVGPSSFRSAVFHAVYFSITESEGKPQFRSDIDLLGCIYDRIQIDWRSLMRYPNGQSRIQPYDRQPYIQLEAALRRLGADAEADAVYADRRRVENQKMAGLSKIMDSSYWLFANYGIDLCHEFVFTSLFVLIGILLFIQPGATLLEETGEETNISWYQALPLAIHQFLPFGLPVKPLWIPSRRTVFKFVWPFRTASAYANFLQIVGWILIPLAAAWLAGFLRHGAQ